jgi:hypothetical protein
MSNLEDLKRIKELVTEGLEHSEQLWNDKSESHAYIIGYLQGALRCIDLYINLDTEETILK